jgi:serine O-acetyltransferase
VTTPAVPTLGALIDADIRTYIGYAFGAEKAASAGRLRKLSALLTPAVGTCVLHRLAHACARRGWRAGARAFATLNYLMHKAAINPDAQIGPGMYLPHPFGAVFHGRAGPGLVLYAGAIVGTASPRGAWLGALDEAPRLGRDVVVAAVGIVLGPRQVGDGVTVGIAAVVDGDVPDGAVVLPRVSRGGRER